MFRIWQFFIFFKYYDRFFLILIEEEQKEEKQSVSPSLDLTFIIKFKNQRQNL